MAHFGAVEHILEIRLQHTEPSPDNDTGCSSTTHPELVGPELVYVWSRSGYWLVPEAELQEELIPAGQQHLSSLLPVGCEFLAMDRH